MEKITLNVEGMTCSHCEKAVKIAIGGLDGVENVMVDLSGNTVQIEYDPDKLTFARFKTVIEEEGYNVVGQI